MKRRTFLALGLTAALSIPFAMTAFAEGSKYGYRDTVKFSGQTDFDYFYTYTAKDLTVYPFADADFKAFSVVAPDGQRFYASVKAVRYEYARKALAGKSVELDGEYWETAGDGAPVVLVKNVISTDAEGKTTSTSLGDFIWPSVSCGKTCESVFNTIYGVYADITLKIAEDSSYLMVDTNPRDRESEYEYNDLGLDHIQKVNKALSLPDWVYQEMMNTRALDGRQREDFDKVSVTWSYHPDHGLEVIYRKK